MIAELPSHGALARIPFPSCEANRFVPGVILIVAVKILLLGTYELGRQPFGLASPTAWLRKRGQSVSSFDLSRQSLDEATLREADLIVFYLPMHTATRIALEWLPAIRTQNSTAHFCACGLYASLNGAQLRTAGFSTILGAEFESDLVRLAEELSSGTDISPAESAPSRQPKLQFEVPDRSGLPALSKYAHVVLPDGTHRIAGYTEASRGCKHLCRHCPVVPVYLGQFRIVPQEVVLADIRKQVAAGAQHITFGDPDFFNGPTHAARIVQALHAEFSALTYDVTIKIEHLLKHRAELGTLARTGCLFITSAVESLENGVLSKLEKGHTRAEFLLALQHCRTAGLTLQPTFIPFTPWTTRASYFDLLEAIADHELISSVPAIQLAIRLLIPSRSRLLELPEIASIVGEFDSEKLVYPWRHADRALDELAEEISAIVAGAEKRKESRTETFAHIWDAARKLQQSPRTALRLNSSSPPAPYLSEPWYC
jgi:radical SAM superfamily enzyme YgiQ (UPF0313 family)